MQLVFSIVKTAYISRLSMRKSSFEQKVARPCGAQEHLPIKFYLIE